MMRYFQRLCLCSFLCLFLSSAASADKIILKTGEEISGKVISRDKYSLKILVEGVPRTYYFKNVKAIESEDPAVVRPEKPPLTAAKRKLILRLMEVNNVREQITITFERVIAEAPAEVRQELKNILRVEDIINRLVPIYDTYYEEEDLVALVAFYSSPAGIKHLEVVPTLLEETFQVTLEYFQEKVAEEP